MSNHEEEQAAIARGLLEGTSQGGGLRKMCIDKKRCGLGMTCEHAQSRGQSVQVGSFWAAPQKVGECSNFFPRVELGSAGDVPKRAPGQSRHNTHAPPRESAREAIQTRNAQFAQQILPPHLQTPPDLKVTRHIKNGRDIKKDDV